MIILVVILVFGCLVYFLRYRERKPQEPTRDQEMVRNQDICKNYIRGRTWLVVKATQHCKVTSKHWKTLIINSDYAMKRLRLRPCPNWRLRLQPRLGRARLPILEHWQTRWSSRSFVAKSRQFGHGLGIATTATATTMTFAKGFGFGFRSG